jgi:hypothetical protein
MCNDKHPELVVGHSEGETRICPYCESTELLGDTGYCAKHFEDATCGRRPVKRGRKVYVAGPLNADACGYITHLHKMFDVALQIHRMGHAPLVPGADFLMGFFAGDFKYADYMESNMAWLRVADCVFVIAQSPGVKKEIAEAEKLGIPVYYRLEDLA